MNKVLKDNYIYNKSGTITQNFSHFNAPRDGTIIVQCIGGRHNSGTYYITQQGLDFILGKGTAPSFVITKNGEVLLTGPEMYIYEIKDYVQEKVEWQEQATPKMVIENVGGKEHAYLF